MKRIVVLPFASVSVIVIYPILMALVLLMLIIDHIIMAIDAVAEFLDYHLCDQIDLLKSAWNGE